MSSTTPPFGTVMIIDDNKMDLYINSQVIARSSFGERILQYSSASEALEYLCLHSDNVSCLPEVIFVDIYMPGMNGFEFMAAYATLPETLRTYTRIFIISSSIDKQDIQRVKADGNITAFHQKPLSRNFLATIER